MKKLSRWILIFGFIFGLAIPGYADLTCDLCKKEITGKYMEYRSSQGHFNICIDCVRTHPKCAACKVPHYKSNMTYHKGEWLCQPCLRDAKFCVMCTDRIEGRYFSLKNHDEFYCHSCYTGHPKCKICGRPKLRGHIDSQSGACRECLPKLKKCNSCGKAITGQYYEFKHSEGYYCADCKRHKEACYVCGVPVGKKYWKYPDGRVACMECNARAVIDVEEIRAIANEAERLLQARLGLVIEYPYELEVQALNKKSMWDAKQAKEGSASSSPLFGRELGLYRRKGAESKIFLLYGLPREIIYETAAHELAHAWQAENCPPQQSEELREGFAQWVGAQVLKMKGYHKAYEKLESRRDYPYGTGYHRIKRVAQNLGLDGVKQYVKKTTR